MDGPRLLLVALLGAATVLAGCTQIVQQVSGQPNNDWALEMTGVAALHDDGLTGRGVKVAVVDTGIDAAHPDFGGVALQWNDQVNGRAEPYDDAGHGTHVSGLVVAQAGSEGLDPRVLGMAPGAALIHVKAVPASGSAEGSDVARAIDRAADMGAHVIVLSLGGGQGLPIIGQQVEDAVNRAIDEGIVVIAAAGNAEEGSSGSECEVSSPGSVPAVIAVAAVDEDQRIADFSCTGNNSGGPLGILRPEDPNRKPELSAPGVALIGPWPGLDCAGTRSSYCVLSGTSQAAPIVGGAVALLLEAHPDMRRQGRDTVIAIKRALTETAETAPGQSAPHDDRYGYGIVRVDEALQRLG